MDSICRTRAFIVLLASFILAGHLFAQIKSEDKNDYLDADYYFYIQEYGKVLEHLNKIHSKYPTHGNINYLIGVCYILQDDNYNKALKYLKTAVGDINEDYRPGDLKFSGAPSDALLYYGDALHSLNSFVEASESYHKFLSIVSEDELSRNIAINRIVGLGLSYEAHIRPPNLKVSELGASFNTNGNEFNPVFSADNEVMLYTSSKETSNRIMYTTKINGEWATPVDITRELGSDGSYYTTSLSHDGSQLFLIKDNVSNKDIYISKYENGLWTRVQALDKKINSLYNETGASISKDGNTIYFSSDKPGGYGGIDIYYAKLINGKWGKPVNFEAPVNTSFDDDRPLISSSGDTIFYSTNGRETIGKMDIFFAVKSKEDMWESLTNIGVPYNTVSNDYLGYYMKSGGNVYLAQNKMNDQGGLDLCYIEKIDIPPPMLADNIKEQSIEPMITQQEQLISEDISMEATQKDESNTNIQTTAEISSIDNRQEKFEIEGKLTGEDQQLLPEKEEPQPVIVEEVKKEPKVDEEKEVSPVEELSYFSEEIQEQQEREIRTNNKPLAPKNKDIYINDKGVNYTIQLMALKNHSKMFEFKGLENNLIKISIGNDGYARYTYGQYSTAKVAQKELLRVYKQGHVNAFIKEVSLISNY